MVPRASDFVKEPRPQDSAHAPLVISLVEGALILMFIPVLASQAGGTQHHLTQYET
jgi:hypothetical protein